MKTSHVSKLFYILLAIILFGCGPSKKASKSFVDPYLYKKDSELTATQRYIKKYREMAMEEMKLSGVPASITLAQGILESGNGNSYLAAKGNNHFGIKCRGDWTGEKIYFDDDEANECFRKYASVAESYRDHSEFLKVNTRYAFLFDLPSTDYKSWAKGLKDAGYATRSNYSELLIDLIEKHELYNYDSKEMLAELKNQNESKENKSAAKPTKKSSFKYNNLSAVKASEGQSYQQIADEYGIDLKTLLDYNDLDENTKLQDGQIVYLKPKKSKAKDSYHIVREQDRLYTIAQDYGVKLDALYEYNMLKAGEEPAVGEIIYLKSMRKEPPEIRVIKPKVKVEEPVLAGEEEKKEEEVADITVKPEEEEIIVTSGGIEHKETGFEEVPVTNGEIVSENEKESANVGEIVKEAEVNPVITNSYITRESKPEVAPINEVGDIEFHFVKKGETLYGISKKFNVKVDDLIRWNQLESNSISEGDTLVIQAKEEMATSNKNIVLVEEKTAIASEPVVEAEKEFIADTNFYIVKEGETLYDISRRYNTTIIDLIAMNHLEQYEVESGTKLVVKLPTVRQKANPVTYNPKPVSGTSKSYVKPNASNVSKPAVSGNTKYHTVVKGETLYRISKMYNISVNRIMELNGLTNSNISEGQKLVVEGTPVAKSTPVKTESKKPQAGKKVHIVQVDETLYSISKKYNVSIEQIKRLNNLTSNIIDVGQELIIE